jgi:hypothetical protein
MVRMDWDALTRELDAWVEAERVLSLWWRDDDAAEPHPALAMLLDMADHFQIEVGLAVIPVLAGESLAADLADRSNVVVLQHGYSHRNYAAEGERSIECGGVRPVGETLGELRHGLLRLQELFDARFRAILAAPWNRIDAAVATRLGDAGFVGLSTFGPRARQAHPPGLAVANAHVDPLNWREGGRFAGLDKALSGLIGEMRARRRGDTESDEPLGLLTHHLQHDAATWAFLERFFGLTQRHPAARWLNVAEVFGLAGSPGQRAVGRR